MTEKSQIAKSNRQRSLKSQGEHMNLKDILGEKYKEDLTVSEIESLLAEKEVVLKEELVAEKERYNALKESLDKATSESATYKRQIRELEQASMTEEEKRQAEMKELQEQLASFKNENRKVRFEKRITELGIKDDNILEPLLALPDDESAEKLLNIISTQVNTSVEEAIKKTKVQNINDTPRPPAPNPSNDDELKKMTLTEQMKLKQSDPERYKQLLEANK